MMGEKITLTSKDKCLVMIAAPGDAMNVHEQNPPTDLTIYLNKAKFIETDEQVLLVIREKDLQKNFPGVSFNVLAEDIAWLRGRVGRERLLDFLWKGELLAAGPSNFTEKIYLVSNK